MWWRKKRKSLRVQELVLENDRGQERARIEVDREDNVVLNFKDEEGNSRLYMGLSAEGTPRIGLHYASGKGSIQLEANDKLKSAALIIVGPSGKAQVLLGIARNGHPAIALYDDAGNQVFPDRSESDGGSWNDDFESFDWDDILHK